MCSEGYASSLAAASLADLGFRHAGDLAGGYRAWSAWARSSGASEARNRRRARRTRTDERWRSPEPAARRTSRLNHQSSEARRRSGTSRRTVRLLHSPPPPLTGPGPLHLKAHRRPLPGRILHRSGMLSTDGSSTATGRPPPTLGTSPRHRIAPASALRRPSPAARPASRMTVATTEPAGRRRRHNRARTVHKRARLGICEYNGDGGLPSGGDRRLRQRPDLGPPAHRGGVGPRVDHLAPQPDGPRHQAGHLARRLRPHARRVRAPGHRPALR